MSERPSELLPPRRYILDKDGEAMLCRDEADAIAEAVRNDLRFPKRGPHVAVQLAPVRTLDAAPLASGPTHDRSGIVAQLLDSANIRELPNWVRVLMQRAADALDAAPSEPSAECWRRAVEQWKAKHGWYVGDRLQAVCEVEALAREIAREGK